MIGRSVAFLGIFLFLGTASAFAKSDSAQTPYEPVERFDPARSPAADLKEAIAEAQRSHRRILLDVGGNWCIWCRYLDSFFVAHKDIAKFMHEHYVVMKVNFSKENENTKFLSAYPRIPGYPHLFVLESDGSLLWSQDTGKLEKGRGHDPVKVLAFLKRWVKP